MGLVTEFFLFIYAMLAIFVVQVAKQNAKAQRQNPQIVTLIGWGLFSASATLALLLAAVALAMATGMQIALPESLDTGLS